MPLRLVPFDKRLWQVVAEAYQPPGDPWKIYAADTSIGQLSAGTLALNFAMGVNTLTLHNPWVIDQWPGAYPLRVPDSLALVDFHPGYDPSFVAFVIGYTLTRGAEDPIVPPRVPTRTTNERPDLPQWVQNYVDFLLLQIERYGEIKVRNLRPEPS